MQANPLETMENLKELAEKFLAIYPEICAMVTGQPMELEDLPIPYQLATQDPDLKISALLQQLGVPLHVKGYGYIKTAIKLLQANESRLFAVTKELYPAIAELHDTTPSRAERAMRHAIELMADKCYPRYSRNFVDQPTNSEFLAWCIETLKFQK